MVVYFFDDDSDNAKIFENAVLNEKESANFFFINEHITHLVNGLKDDTNKDDTNTVVFLNTRMHFEKYNSFEIASKIRKQNRCCHIIFISSFLEDMPFCFKNLIKPSGFLLKPLRVQELSAILKSIREANMSFQEEKKIVICKQGTKYSFSQDEVTYFTTLGKKIICKTVSGKIIEFYGTLHELEERFEQNFIRCHSGFLANKKIIIGMSKNMLILKNSTDRLPVSKKYKEHIANYLKIV